MSYLHKSVMIFVVDGCRRVLRALYSRSDFDVLVAFRWSESLMSVQVPPTKFLVVGT